MIMLEPLGDRAWMARFGDGDEAARWASSLRASPPVGVVDVVLAYFAVAVFADPSIVDLATLEQTLRTIPPEQDQEREVRHVTIPVLYDGDDLAWVAGQTSRSVDEVVAIHTGSEYVIQAMGFLPGFPYAGDLDPRLRGLPRRSSPRDRVPAGSVAIVGNQTAIYPVGSPGGWHLLGRTPWIIAVPEATLFPMRVGDRLRFRAIGREEYREQTGEWLR